MMHRLRALLMGTGPAPAASAWRWSSGVLDVDGNTVYTVDPSGAVTVGPAIDTLTPRSMQEECAQRGCDFQLLRLTTLAMLTHRSERGISRVDLRDADTRVILAQADAWRRSLHEVD
jgi:hypothetical protein